MEGKTENGWSPAEGPRGARDSRSIIPCRFFAQNSCRKGDSCPFSHAVPEQEQPHRDTGSQIQQVQDTVSPVASRSQIPCRYHLEGRCFRGDECHFAHDRMEERREERARPKALRRELRGALVTFGDGAMVTKVNFPCDFSAVRIRRLRRNANVVNFLAAHGFDVSEDFISTFSEDGEYRTADVQVDDPLFAERLCDVLDVTSPKLPKAVPIYARVLQTDYGRIESRKVACVFEYPGKRAWLLFHSFENAREARYGFRRGAYKVLGRAVGGCAPIPDQKIGGCWAFELEGIPVHAGRGDIICDLPAELAPRSIELDDGSSIFDLPPRYDWLRVSLRRAGPFHWEPSSDMPGGRARATARFAKEANAWQAVVMDHLGGRLADLSLRLIHSVRSKVSTRIYDGVKLEIDELHQTAWVPLGLVYIVYDSSQGYRVLKIEGEDREAVAGAKDMLDTIINEQVDLGGEAHYQGRQGSNTRDPEASSIPKPNCPVCLEKAENPVTPEHCKHVYCAACFERLCLVGANRVGPIRCCSDGGICTQNQIISLTDLQTHLSPIKLDEVLEVAFNSHLRIATSTKTSSGGQILYFCPTPDCPQLYVRPAPDNGQQSVQGARSALVKCTACPAVICTDCQNFSHEGLTCERQQQLVSSSSGYRALQEAKMELGIKHCPKCGIMIEKLDGCRHVLCSNCHVDFCWVCLKTEHEGFEDADVCERCENGAR